MIRRALTITLLSLISTLLSGCTAAAFAAAGATAGFGIAQGQAESFIRGELSAARMVSLEQAEEATLQMMDELQLRIITHRKGKYDAFIRGKGEGGPEIKITLEQKSPLITKFETRVGMMGDQAVSRLVMARIDVMLGIEHPLVPVEISPIVAPRRIEENPAANPSPPPGSAPPSP